jgi:GDPmannose 4,6-dehydratase
VSTKSAAIIGSAGQDGTLLKQRLDQLDYEVYLIDRGSIDVQSPQQVQDFVSDTRPDEIYYLAAYHHSSEEIPNSSSSLFRTSFDVNAFGPLNFLEAISLNSKSSKFFYASSCHIFEPQIGGLQNENMAPKPRGSYAISKKAANDMCAFFRETEGVFASVGILYNHESSLRKDSFVTRKIIRAAVNIAKNKAGDLHLVDPFAKVDWGYAPDYVEAMRLILKAEEPDDFIIATGVPHSVWEFADLAFQAVGLKAEDFIITENKEYSQERPARIGDASKLRKVTGWRPTVSFHQMIELLIQAEAQRVKLI